MPLRRGGAGAFPDKARADTGDRWVDKYYAAGERRQGFAWRPRCEEGGPVQCTCVAVAVDTAAYAFAAAQVTFRKR